MYQIYTQQQYYKRKFFKKFSTKTSFIILILSIIGLILSLFVPWIYYEVGTTSKITATYNGELKKTSGNYLKDEFMIGKERDYYKEKYMLNLVGFILTIVFSAMVFVSSTKKSKPIQKILLILFSSLILIPIILISNSSSSFINLSLMQFHSNYTQQQIYGSANITLYSPSGIANLIISIILLFLCILTIYKELASIKIRGGKDVS